jgi:hypothetical protein
LEQFSHGDETPKRDQNQDSKFDQRELDFSNLLQICSTRQSPKDLRFCALWAKNDDRTVDGGGVLSLKE